MPMIREVVVTTIDALGQGASRAARLDRGAGGWIIAPFRPSTTLDNLLAVPFAVANYVDDARIFAGLVTGRRDWPMASAPQGRPPRLAAALAHAELKVMNVDDHKERPRFHCRVQRVENHAPFNGFNRAAKPPCSNARS